MRKMGYLVLIVSIIVVSCQTAYSQPSLDDFLPPDKGGAAEIQNPAKVNVDVKNNIVVAASLQDAILAGVEQHVQMETKKGVADAEKKESLIRKRDFSSALANRGAWTAASGSGLAFFATGSASYGQHDDDTTTLIAQRRAYLVAYMEAKGLLTEFQNKIEAEGTTNLATMMDQAFKSTGSATNTMTQIEEKIKQASAGILRGFVIFEVKDDVSQDKRKGNIFVTIVSSPKTQGKLSRLSSNTIEAKKSLRDGLAEVLEEIKQGMVPPVGGYTVAIPGTSEYAFIGYGSHVIAHDDNPVAQDRIAVNSLRIAELRAKDALAAIIIGDEVSTQGVTETKGADGLIRFARESDPLDRDNGDQIKKFDEAKNVFYEDTGLDTFVKSKRKGVLPPGVTVKSWFNEDKTWAQSMAVYNPTTTGDVRKSVSEMKSTSILDDDEKKLSEREKSNLSPQRGSSSNGEKEGGKIKQGPTGRLYNGLNDL